MMVRFTFFSIFASISNSSEDSADGWDLEAFFLGIDLRLTFLQR
jgi:hypothetical protein